MIIAQKEGNLIYIIRKLKQDYEETGQEINLDKTEYLEIIGNLVENLKLMMISNKSNRKI